MLFQVIIVSRDVRNQLFVVSDRNEDFQAEWTLKCTRRRVIRIEMVNGVSQ